MWIISIHAPRTGSDFSSSRIVLISSNFNPRSPHGERPATPNAIVSMVTFQSTLPARGATQSSTFITHLSAFQSTLPARGATRFSMLADTTFKHFNPRSPHGERQNSSGSYTAGLHFNPRSPHGERQQTVWKHSDIRRNFNPRSPHGERLQSFDRRCGRGLFQSTLPARGATLAYLVAPFAAIKFQSTLPARGATLFSPATPRWQAISIHAPRTGSDACLHLRRRVADLFQSTLPARGATSSRICLDIHIPRFQSTLPARGATRCAKLCLCNQHHFNPRSPHGERPPR